MHPQTLYQSFLTLTTDNPFLFLHIFALSVCLIILPKLPQIHPTVLIAYCLTSLFSLLSLQFIDHSSLTCSPSFILWAWAALLSQPPYTPTHTLQHIHHPSTFTLTTLTYFGYLITDISGALWLQLHAHNPLCSAPVVASTAIAVANPLLVVSLPLEGQTACAAQLYPLFILNLLPTTIPEILQTISHSPLLHPTTPTNILWPLWIGGAGLSDGLITFPLYATISLTLFQYTTTWCLPQHRSHCLLCKKFSA